MSLPSPDKGKNVEKQLLTAEYNAWFALLEGKTDVVDYSRDSVERQYDFAIDRREDKESQVTAEKIRVDLLIQDETLEGYIDIENSK